MRTKEKAIAYVKEKLADPEFRSYGLLAYTLRDVIAQENKNLQMLIYLLGDPNEYCSRSEIEYIIEKLEGG